MHFKKIVAGFLSASILTTTAIVAPVTVSAATEDKTIFDGEIVLTTYIAEQNTHQTELTDVTLTGSEFTDYETLSVSFKYSESDVEAVKSNYGNALNTIQMYFKDSDTSTWTMITGDNAIGYNYWATNTDPVAGTVYTSEVTTESIVALLDEAEINYSKGGILVAQTGYQSSILTNVEFTDPIAGEIEEEEEVKIPEGYTSHTFEKSQWSDGAEATVVSIDSSTVEPTDTITFTYETNVSNSAWKIAYVDTATWTKNISSAQGALTYTATVQDLMDAADVDTVSELGSAIAIQIWNISIGDQIAYKYEITKAEDVEEDVEEEKKEPISGETKGKTIAYEQVYDATAATESYGYTSTMGSTEDSNTYAQVSDNTTWRIYKLVSLEELKGKTSASVFVMNKTTGKVVKLTTKVVYQKLNDTTTALKGYAYVVFVIENVTSPSDDGSGHFTSDLMWSDIILN